MLWYQVVNLFPSNVEDDKHWLVSLNNINFMLTPQVICKGDVVLLALANQGECRVWRLFETNIVDTVCPLVVSGYDILADYLAENCSLVITATSLISFFGNSNFVEYRF